MIRDWFFTRRKQTEETMTFSALKKDRHAVHTAGTLPSDLTTMTDQDKVSCLRTDNLRGAV